MFTEQIVYINGCRVHIACADKLSPDVEAYIKEILIKSLDNNDEIYQLSSRYEL